MACKCDKQKYQNNKRINTELFIDRNMGLYILLLDKETDQETSLDKKTDKINK